MLIAIYSASVEESAIVFCVREVHKKIPFANFKKKPICERRVFGSDGQSESVPAIKPV